jgi:1-acyl-sn-glycerol-3-phosphate acyltransferase
LNKIATTAEHEKDGAEARPEWMDEHDVALKPGGPGNAGAAARTVAARKSPAQRYGWGSRLRSYFIIDPLVWVYTLVLGTVSLVCSLFDRSGRIQHKLATAWSWLIMKTILSPVTVTGNVAALQSGGVGDGSAADRGASRPRVFAVTHASALDIPILYVYLPFQFRIVFKSELLSYPFVGWHLKRSGQVCINQQNPAASVGAIKSALRSLRGGMPLVIFPEGGRTSDGKIQPFLPGAFFLAIKAQAEIVPIALVDTFDLLPMNTYHVRCQPLEMRVGEVIPTAGLKMADMDALTAKVKKAIEELHGAPPQACQ